MPPDVPAQPTETCPGCGAVLVPVPDGGSRHPGASPSCARLFEVTLRGLREEADAAPRGGAVVALADAAYDAQHPVAGDPGRLRAALDRLGAPPDLDLSRPPQVWRTTIADVAADLDVIDLQVLVESWARAVADDWATVTTHRA
ncbi:DUF5946 family protein [Blastococcus sp. SYSU D00922]